VTETGSPRYNVPVPNHQRIVLSAFKINGNGNGSTVCSQMQDSHYQSAAKAKARLVVERCACCSPLRWWGGRTVKLFLEALDEKRGDVTTRRQIVGPRTISLQRRGASREEGRGKR
jgi:hypothetical protein